ncbi:MAG TPA: hypothetical protein VKB96_11100 [Gammaproteobacteria bacterium]|nr:hypothetical protein [Gammaproteobacteria bacterium]
MDLLGWKAESKDAPLYGWHDEIPSWDFNRELFAPGQNPGYPDGVIYIRVDDDFWIVASLPWRFLNTPLDEVVRVIWPSVHEAGDYSLKPDTGPNIPGETP